MLPETTGCPKHNSDSSGAARQTLQADSEACISFLWHVADLSAFVSCPKLTVALQEASVK